MTKHCLGHPPNFKSVLMPFEEVDRESRDLIDLFVECKVAGVEQVDLGVRHVALESKVRQA
jgi:hypothetical protein